jgi:hypothetical protein
MDLLPVPSVWRPVERRLNSVISIDVEHDVPEHLAAFDDLVRLGNALERQA